MRAAVIATAVCLTAFGQQGDVLWGRLEPGPHAVGYRSYFELDSSRAFRGGKSRPVLVAMWYPAEAASETLRYAGYFNLPAVPEHPQFGAQLGEFLLDTFSEGLFRKKPAELTPQQREFMERVLSSPTRAYRDAPPARGRFPVILYHAGAAGSLEENSVLCEYLASHGYVVMTSAFPSADGRHVSNNYGGPETSWADLAFLLRRAQAVAFADAAKAGAIGHSMGAQYLLEWLGRKSPGIAAVVSLDTTLEYTAEKSGGHRPLRRRLSRLAPIRLPVLIAASADRQPRFATWDRYLPRRSDVAIRYFAHSDFTLHGPLGRAFRMEQVIEVRRNYDRLVRAVAAFFHANLRGSAAAWKRTVAETDAEFQISEHD